MTASVMAVLQPLKVVITNYPENETELLMIENNSENEALGKGTVPFSKTIYIEREDFMEEPPKGFHRLCLNGEVRLKGAYFIRCEEVIKDPNTGEITELRCTYDPLTKSGTGFTGRKVKGTIHWVSAEHAVKANVHLYEKLLLEQELPNEARRGLVRCNQSGLGCYRNGLFWWSLLLKMPAQAQKFQFFVTVIFAWILNTLPPRGSYSTASFH